MNSVLGNNFQQFTPLEFLAKQVVEGFLTGMHKSPFHGFSVEFAEHRLYNKGESTRHIDWKLYGKTEKLFIKRYEEETNLRCQFVIDNSSSMYFPVDESKKAGQKNKVQFAVYCTAVLMELLKRQRDAVGLSVYGESLEIHTPSKSSSIHQRMIIHELEKLLEYRPPHQQVGTATSEVLHTIAERLHKRSLVVLFSDWMEPHADIAHLFSAIQHLKHNKHEVILFQVMDKEKEFDFNFESRPYRFVDLESGDTLKINPAGIKDVYKQKTAAFLEELKSRCHGYKVDFIQADISLGFEQVLMPYLLKRSSMV